jgi:TatD DNase family protein
MPLIDSHAHLTYPEFSGQIGEVLDRCAQAGVERVISIGTSLADAESAITLAREYPGRVHAAAGFHPHHTDTVSQDDIAAMARLWLEPEVVAQGEMGLDYHYDFADRANQRKVFEGQLRAARSQDKAIIIHSREAFADSAAMLLDHGFRDRRVVFHCFTGTAEEAAAIAEYGWRISFTGIVTFPKSEELQAIARDYPADKLMVETDSPYLSPVPVRSRKPNEPAFVAHTARFLAQLRGVTFERLCEETFQNTLAFFRFSMS